MSVDYEVDPRKIEQESFRRIRELTALDAFDRVQQQVVMRVVHSLGLPEIVSALRFSARACEQGMAALGSNCAILCDVEMVREAVTRRLLSNPALCFLNDPRVAEIARESGETRSMTALNFWEEQLAGSVVLIGNAPTALFRLLEMLRETEARPALVVAMPVGFVGADESKQLLWDSHSNLGVECITLLGRQGGSAVTAASCNALLRCNHDEWY